MNSMKVKKSLNMNLIKKDQLQIYRKINKVVKKIHNKLIQLVRQIHLKT